MAADHNHPTMGKQQGCEERIHPPAPGHTGGRGPVRLYYGMVTDGGSTILFRLFRLIPEPIMTAPAAGAAIWDVDGTLVDTAELHYRAWGELAAAIKKPFTRADFAA